MNRARRLRRWLRQPSPWTRGGTLLCILLVGSSHDVGMFLIRNPWADTALQWILGTVILAMTARFGWLYWRRRRDH